MARKFTVKKSIWLYIILLISSIRITYAKEPSSFRTNLVDKGIVNGNPPSMVLSVPNLEHNTNGINNFTFSNTITPLDPVLRSCASTTSVAVGSTVSATLTGNNTSPGYTTQFVLLDDTGKIVAGPLATASFEATGAGIFKIVAVNYSGSISGLLVGQNISNITGNCWEISAPKCFTVQSVSCAIPTQIVLGNALTASISGNNTSSGYTTQFVMTDANYLIIAGPSNTASFTPTTAGSFKIYAINYSGTLTGLAIGSNFISGVTGACVSKSGPKCYSVINSTCSSPQQVVLGNPLTATISGNNTTAGYSTQYVLTDANDLIVQGPSSTASFNPSATGSFKIYAINFSGTVTGLTVGTNFLTGVSGDCISKSAPKCFVVVCSTISNLASNNQNPTFCGGSNGSIKICGLVPNQIGYTINYSKNGTALPALINQTAGSDGCLSISNLTAGSYTNIIVSSTGCTATNSLSATLSDPSAPLAPSLISGTTNLLCTGQTSTLMTTGVTGATYNWTVTPVGATLSSVTGTTSGTNSSNTLSASQPGTYTVSVTQTLNGCTSLPITASVTINGLSTAPNISGGSTLTNQCPGTTVDLKSKESAPIQNQTFEWHSVSSNPSSSTIISNPSFVSLNGTYYLYAKSTIGGCFSPASTPVTVNIQSCSCTEVVLGNPLVAIVTGNNTSVGYTTQFVLTDANDVIVQGPASSGSFTPTATGSYKIYSVNFTGSVGGLSPGTNFLTGVSGSCVAKSSPKCYTVICPKPVLSVQNIVCNGTGTGYTVTFSSNAPVTASGTAGTNVLVSGNSLTVPSGNVTLTSTTSCGEATSLVVTAPVCPTAPQCTQVASLSVGNAICIGNGTYSVSFTALNGTVTSTTTIGGTLAAGTVSGNSVINIPVGTNAVLTLTPTSVACSGQIVTVTSPASCVTPGCTDGSVGISYSTVCNNDGTYNINYTTSVANTTVTPANLSNLTGPVTLTVTKPFANCTPQTVIVTPPVCIACLTPTLVSASPATICAGASSTLAATCSTGTLTLYTEAGLTGTALISNVVSPTVTTTYYAACVTGACKSVASSVTVTVTPTPGAPTAATASPSSICSGTSTTLTASCSTGTLTWYTDASLTTISGTIVNPSSTKIYFATCKANGCESKATEVTVIVSNCISSLKIVKSQTAISGQTVGSTIAYSLVVTNTGATTLTNVTVTDANAAITGTNPIASLAPAASVTLTAVHTITQSDLNTGKVLNTANVTGSTPIGGSVTDVSDTGTDPTGTTILNAESVDGPDTDTDPTNDPTETILTPIAVNDLLTAPAGTTSMVNVLSNDNFLPGVNTTLIGLPGGTATGTVIFDPLTGLMSYTPSVGESGIVTQKYKVCNTTPDPDQCAEAVVTITVTDVVAKLIVKVLLQGALLPTSSTGGPIMNGIMRDDLRMASPIQIPNIEPYSAFGNPRFTHTGGGGGEIIGPGVLTVSGNDAVVDWVFVELRDKNNPANIIKTRSALLQRDGDVVESSDGTTPLTFTGSVGESYFVSVKHRNHLGAMTLAPIAMTTVGTLVDFTTMNAIQTWNFPGYDGFEQVDVNGKMALWAGNTNADKKVKYVGVDNDQIPVFSQAVNYTTNTTQQYNYDFATPVYLVGDVNMDAKVKYRGPNNDASFIFFNVITKYAGLNTGALYNYDLFIEQIP